MNAPFFSIVIPTRNRPGYVKECVKTVLDQTYHNFEIIISDNGTTHMCLEEIKKFSDGRIIYKCPESPLGLCDNFEFACKGFKGDYLILLGDKHRLFKEALEEISVAVINKKPDIITFISEIYTVLDTKHDDGDVRDLHAGYFKRIKYSGDLSSVDPCSVLEEKMRFEDPFGFEKGLIYGNSAYSKEIIELITRTNQNGRLFDGVIPDRYTSFLALGIAKNIQYIEKPLSIYMRNGSHTSDVGKTSLDSLENVCIASNCKYDINTIKEYLPLKSCFGLIKNIQAGDYLYAIDRLKESRLVDKDIKLFLKKIKLDKANFVYEVEDELADIPSTDPKRKTYANELNGYYDSLEEEKKKIVKKKRYFRNKNVKKYKALIWGFMFISKIILKKGSDTPEWRYRICNIIDRKHIYIKNINSYL